MNELIDRVAKLPNNQKIAVVVGLYVIIGVAFFFLSWMPRSETLSGLRSTQSELKREKKETQAIADNLEQFRKEVAERKEQLDQALKALPNERNFDQLMSRMETLAKRIGLDVILLEPRPDVFQDFYAEVPFKMEVSGAYHEVALFFYRLGTMARIVNVQDVSMSKPEEKNGKVMIQTSAVATTYRFLDEAEREEVRKRKEAKAGGKKGKKKTGGEE